MSVHLDDNLPELPSCTYCGRAVLVGPCCRARSDVAQLRSVAMDLREALLELKRNPEMDLSSIIRRTHHLKRKK